VRDFAAIQRWMTRVATHDGDVADAVRAAASGAAAGVSADDVVLPSAALSALERVGVYHGMYSLRLERVLAADYPATRELLGDAAFARLARAYATERPSRSFTLEVFGRALPAFLVESDVVSDPRLRAAAADLARFERLVDAARAALDAPPLAADALADVPQDAWADLRFAPRAGAQRGVFDHDVVAAWNAWRDDRPVRRPARRRLDVVVFRNRGATTALRLRGVERRLFDALASGRTLGAALSAAAASADAVRAAFARLFAAGVFGAVADR